MTYDHSNSDNSSGDSMGHSDSGDLNSRSSSRPKTPVAKEAKIHCSHCGTAFLKSESKNMPFCSRRCQQIDLGMWLTESYGIPYEGDSNERRYERNEERNIEDD